VEICDFDSIICMLFILKTASILYGWLVGAFLAGTGQVVSGCGEKAVDCQHGETDRHNGPNYAETKAV
jgi:hypothetical protein